jgi:glycosyltransferase involved in cell wall biosynthesis
MAAQTDMNSYQRGVELAEVGHYEAALNCMREHLRGAPDDAQALNDTGAILHCLGRSDDAIEYLRKANQLRSESGEIVWNLVEAYLAAGMACEAASLFAVMERTGVLNVEVLNRTATMLLDQGKNGQAVEVLLRSFRLWPDQEVLTPILEVIRSKRPKIALFRSGSGDDAALADAWVFVEERFMVEYHRDHVADGMEPLVEWSDIAWFDGGGEMVVEASRLPRTGKTIVSLRRSDVRGDWVKEVRWEQVDILVQIGSSAVEEALLERVPDLRTRTRLVVIPNGMNLARYVYRQRTRGKHLACMGCLSMEANPAFLLQCMQKLHYIDADYRLFFSGRFESPVLEQYVRHMVQTLGLSDAVLFEPYPSDLNGWLADKHFIVSSGIGESQVEPLVAGMASGLKPVAHNFPGAETLLPSACLFNIAEEFCERVVCQDYDPAAYRRFVEDRYPIAEQLRQVNSILMQLETEINLQSLNSTADGCDTGSGGFASLSGEPGVASPANISNL